MNDRKHFCDPATGRTLVGDGAAERLYEMNPTARFSDRAADYARYRPTYPAAAMDAILDGLGGDRGTAADVGAGTGISARLLADRGFRVLAIEPNAAMREAAAAHPGVEYRNAAAESTGLSADSVDVVLCAQAFHWFRQPEALGEFARILRPSGRLALMWNQRDAGDPLTAGYRQAIIDVGGEHPAEMLEFDPAVMDRSLSFTPHRRHEFPHSQTLDLCGLIGRATSASYVPNSGPSFDELHRRLEVLFEKHRNETGHVVLRYVTQVFLADRLP